LRVWRATTSFFGIEIVTGPAARLTFRWPVAAPDLDCARARAAMSNIVYFDLETQRSAEEVGGWDRIRDMRMSVGVTFSTARGTYEIYEESRAPALIEELRRADLVVGFNILRFDYEVLTAYNPFFDPQQVHTLDMLVELDKTLPHRLSLDAIAAASLGVEKTGDGLQALRWFRQGRMLEIAEYCCYDVKLTRLVHEYGRERKRLFYTTRFGKKSVPVSW
jgi:DEAD/DEAH box helicase domain-containing protein